MNKPPRFAAGQRLTAALGPTCPSVTMGTPKGAVQNTAVDTTAVILKNRTNHGHHGNMGIPRNFELRIVEKSTGLSSIQTTKKSIGDFTTFKVLKFLGNHFLFLSSFFCLGTGSNFSVITHILGTSINV